MDLIAFVISVSLGFIVLYYVQVRFKDLNRPKETSGWGLCLDSFDDDMRKQISAERTRLKFDHIPDREFKWTGMGDHYRKTMLIREWWGGPIKLVAGGRSYETVRKTLNDFGSDSGQIIHLEGNRVWLDKAADPDYFGIIPQLQHDEFTVPE